MGKDLYRVPLYWCLTPQQYHNKLNATKTLHPLPKYQKYNLKNIAEHNLITNILMDSLVSMKESLMLSFTDDSTSKYGIVSGDNYQLFVQNNSKNFCANELIQFFVLRKLIKQSCYINMVLTKLCQNVKSINNIYNNHGMNVVRNTLEFIIIIISDALLLVRIRKTKFFLPIIQLLINTILKYNHHKYTGKLISSLTYILMYTSSTQRTKIRTKFKKKSIKKGILMKGLRNCVLMYLFIIIYKLYLFTLHHRNLQK